MTEVVTFLSGAPDSKGSAIVGVAQYPSLTTIHTVPAGETHEIWLNFVSLNSGATIEILGDMGEISDNFDLRLAIEANESRGPFMLLGGSGGTTVALGVITNQANLRVSGTVRKHS